MAEPRGSYQTAVSAASICLHIGADAFELHVLLGDMNVDDCNLVDAAKGAESFAARTLIAALWLLDANRREEALEDAYSLYQRASFAGGLH